MFNVFKNREDTEHEQAIIRIVVTICTFIYLYVSYEITGRTDNRILALSATSLYLLFSIFIVIAIVINKNISVPRRIIGILTDTSIVTYAMIITGDIGAPLYGAYLWIIIANGLRFGKKYLYKSQLLSVIGFSYVVFSGSFWHEYPTFAAGLLIWLMLIPPYVGMLISRMEDAIKHAKQADAAKSDFLANMSHELRTPLNAIIGYSELLAEETHEDGLVQYSSDLQKIHHSGTHLLSLINEILDLSKVEQGQMEIYSEEIDLRQLLDEVRTTIEPLAEKNANQFRINLSPDIVSFRTDLTKLRQVLFNLLSNACKFTHEGLIVLNVLKKVDDEQSSILFTIEDNGIGIAPEKIDAIFEPFRQEATDTTKKFGGTGLGLAISKCFIELLGGKLLLSSRKGEGSVFTVQLPDQLPAHSGS
jgi:two-component system sensor histidine kinase RpfC